MKKIQGLQAPHGTTSGKSKDEVLCNVIPMHVGHILLGRPWKFDRKVTHDGYKKRYALVLNNCTIMLIHLWPAKAYVIKSKL